MNTPIITGADAEGAGEMFQVTNLDLDSLPLGDKEDGTTDMRQRLFWQKTHPFTCFRSTRSRIGEHLALGEVYTFGPTFRAENSNTSRHLSEFWMIEPEVAFNTLEDNMDLAEDFLKYCIRKCA